MSNTRVLVTGASGFIGYHLCEKLVQEGHAVIGIDNLNEYYSIRLKEHRLEQLRKLPRFTFHKVDITENTSLSNLFADSRPDAVIHLAALVGTRHSIQYPQAYIDANIRGFVNVLEESCKAKIGHFVFASSSSVYGNNPSPFSEDQRTDFPLTPYAVTKKMNELMAYTYSSLHGIKCTGLRFFSVYGPWGRPDMAYYSFARSILEGRPIDVYNFGKSRRDFTYIDDVTDIILKLLPRVRPDLFKIYNIGSGHPVPVAGMIDLLEELTGRKAVRNLLPEARGDATSTYASIHELERDIGSRTFTPLARGLASFLEWYRPYRTAGGK